MPSSGTTPATGSVSINDVTISEGNSGTKEATFTVTRSGGTAAFAVNFATSNGTATAGYDYAATSGTLNFGASENTKTISVTINGDTNVEANQTFNVVLSNATNGATISDNQGVGTITNDDGAAIAGSVSINDITISEGNSGTKEATFTVTRSGGTAAFAVNFATSNGTATVADNDYAASSGTLHFGANENAKTISVTVNGDTRVEGNETFNVALSNATNGATISDGQGVGTITNDDGAPTPIFTSGADTVTLPILGGTFNARGGNDKLAYTGGPVTIDGGRGNDTVDFNKFGSAVWVNLSNNGPEIWTRDRPDLSSGSSRAIGDLTNVENLVGTAYSDFLQGNKRGNTLQGGDGNDTLTGGGGADTFVFDHLGRGSQHQHDVIVDFRPGVDRIDLAATPLNDFADLFTVGDRYMEQVGNDLLIHTSVSADTSILLQNVPIGSVTQSDFLF
jgi:Ca2+-binding RTX toxin-like protein